MNEMKHDQCAECNTEGVCEVTVNAKCKALVVRMEWSDWEESVNSSSPNRTNFECASCSDSGCKMQITDM